LKTPTDVEYCDSDNSWMLYFGVKRDTHNLMPLGKQFSILYSPTTYHSKSVWRLVVYRAVMQKNALNPTAKKSRMYEVVSTRPLNNFEAGEAIAYIEEHYA
jgi:hypothetical protein